MTAAVLSILPKRKGRQPKTDEAQALRLFPVGRGGRTFIYAIAFHGDVVKVGQTNNPQRRLREHWRSVSGEVTWVHLFESMHQETATLVERLTPAALEGLAEQINGSEWFFASASKAEIMAVIRPLIARAKAEVNARWAANEERLRRRDALANLLVEHGLLKI